MLSRTILSRCLLSCSFFSWSSSVGSAFTLRLLLSLSFWMSFFSVISLSSSQLIGDWTLGWNIDFQDLKYQSCDASKGLFLVITFKSVLGIPDSPTMPSSILRSSNQLTEGYSCLTVASNLGVLRLFLVYRKIRSRRKPSRALQDAARCILLELRWRAEREKIRRVKYNDQATLINIVLHWRYCK